MRWIAALALALAASPLAARAQLDPSDHWQTIDTKHFHIHFPRGLDSLGRRAAVDAERAFAELSTELKAPTTRIDLVVSDNVDYVNGYATTVPSNRIVVFAHPPIDSPELRNYDDWLKLVVTHELTHVFHLDRADGVWRLGRKVFGRHPLFFPNQFLPSWVIEGLAVYYESRITGAGRLEGTEHYMIARAAAEANRIPRIGALSRETTRFPGGEVVYSYGSLILDYLSRTRGPDKIPKFVDVTSKVVLPLSLNRKAKRSFGISFENAWRDWRDSLVRTAHASPPLPDWKELTHQGRYVTFPRWMSDTSLIYPASTGKEVASVYSVTTSGRSTRLSRRNGLDVNVPLADGSIVFSQPDYTDPFHFRNDLYIERNGDARRITHGARISQPDVRADGTIVAVQNVPLSSILVLLSPPDYKVVPLQIADLGAQYAEPRWSPDGRSIAAVRMGGGRSAIVVIDAVTKSEREIRSANAILASPSWALNGAMIFYTMTRSGRPQVAASDVTGAGRAALFTNASTGAFNPEVSPNQKNLAALSFRFDGYHLGYGELNRGSFPGGTSVDPLPPSGRETSRPISVAAPLTLEDVPPAHSYSPWKSLAPRYWEPVLTSSTDDGTALGAATSGEDVLGRHVYYAQAAYNIDERDSEGFLSYRYAGLGQPYLDFSAEQFFDHFDIATQSTGVIIGELSRRTRRLGASATLVRPRVRNFASLSIGADIESRSYSTDPDTLLSRLSAGFQETRNYPSIIAGASWTNTRRPSLSISREDGISLSVSARERWRTGDFSNASRSVVGVTGLYKSLDLPGFAHHVIALRAAGGYADERAISTFEVGGLSGGSLEALTGIAIGGQRRTFGVRGFPAAAEQGIRALAGTAEYRAPIATPYWRAPLIPLFFDRISVAVFGDAGRAFCPADALASAPACAFTRAKSPWLASAGGEVNFDTAVQYDVALRLRAGFAIPVVNREAGRAGRATLYVTAGSFF